jgi:hypothetical protein
MTSISIPTAEDIILIPFFPIPMTLFFPIPMTLFIRCGRNMATITTTVSSKTGKGSDVAAAQ